MTQPDLDRLDADTAKLMALIAAIAPKAGLQPAETARIDQLAASLRHPAKHQAK